MTDSKRKSQDKPLHEKKISELPTYKRLNKIKVLGNIPMLQGYPVNNVMTDKEREYFIIGQKVELKE